MKRNFGATTRSATKWSLISETIAKIIIPVTQLVLARILAPEAFGVVATVIMITSFAEMISDAGFQRYLVQHEFSSKRDLYRAATVAFWSSMTIALVLLLAMVLFRNQVAVLVGTPGLGVPIAVASLSLPISVFVSTQQALFRRAFEYKKLLPIRVTVAAIPLVVAVPLALLGLDYWSLIIGTLSAALVNAVAMTVISPWKPRLFYSFSLLREMFSFSSWSLLESISIWASLWAGTFIVGSILTPYELGLYRQPILVINSAFALVTNATTPILFAALSRLQFDRFEFKRFFLQFQFSVAVVILPIGVGAFFYRDFFTNVLFGDQWTDAALMFGCWGLTTSLAIIFSHYCSEVYRSLGKPKISFLAQCIYIAIMAPSLYFAAQHGFVTLVIVNASVRVLNIAVNQTLTKVIADIGFIQVVKSLHAPLIATAAMGVLAYWLSSVANGRWLVAALGITVCGVTYLGISLCFRTTRNLIRNFISTLRKKANVADEPK